MMGKQLHSVPQVMPAFSLKRLSFHICTFAALSLALAACSGSPSGTSKGRYDPKYGVSASPRVASADSDIRKGGGRYKVGKPYKVAGRTYIPKDQPGYNKTGKASWYGDDFHGRLTANGEVFDMNALMAAHPTLPLPSYARVTNLKNGRSVIVRINDRGPYAHNRIIDMSKRAAELLGYKRDGIASVRVKYIGRARMDGQDGRYLEASLRRKGEPVGDDSRAVPREGQERFTQPAIMVASAKPAPKKRSNFLLAAIQPLGGARSRTIPNMAPSPEELASLPTSGWAPVDLVGDGYFPPDMMNALQSAPVQLANMAPVQLNYATSSSLRVEKGYQAIEALISQPAPASLSRALAAKAAKLHGQRIVEQPSKGRQIIGTFSPAYARRLAEEFAAVAAVDLTTQKNGQSRLTIARLKPGVGWNDIAALQQQLGLVKK